MNPLGANAWIWVSPLTDERLEALAPRVRAWGFDVLELPIEQHGDWDPARAAEILQEHGLRASVCVAMGPGRELCATDAATVASTQAFLKDVHRHRGGRRRRRDRRADLRVGRADLADDARRAEALLRRAAREPGAARGARRRARREGRDRAARPLRDERDQHHRAGARGDRRPPAGGLRAARRHATTRTSRRRTSPPRSRWRATGSRTCTRRPTTAARRARTTSTGPRSATRSAPPATTGPIVIESFTAENETIATAASVWRPLAASQDDIAVDGLAFLRGLLG